jgi:cbb3-type cytochrome oxidase subunit 3
MLNSSRGMCCYGLFTPYGQLLGLFLLLLLYTTIVCCSYIYPAVTEEDYDYGSAIITPLTVGVSILTTVFFLAMCFIGSTYHQYGVGSRPAL